MVAPRPYHQVQGTAAGERHCFACCATSWPRGDVCLGARPVRLRADRAEALLATVTAERDMAAALLRECRAVLTGAIVGMELQQCDPALVQPLRRLFRKLAQEDTDA